MYFPYQVLKPYVPGSQTLRARLSNLTINHYVFHQFRGVLSRVRFYYPYSTLSSI
jgi:hypothetical protein